MKNIITIWSLLLLSVTSITVNAQPEHHKERWERYRSEKIAFLTSKLDLSPEEAQKFWPVYNQLDKERSELQRQRFELEQRIRESGDEMSDEEIIALTREFVQSRKKEGALDEKYNEEFLRILPPKKVLSIYKAEGEFRMYMFKKYRNERGKGQGAMKR